MKIELSLMISTAAFILSIINAYFQWFRIKGARIDLLNANDVQTRLPLMYKELPQYVQELFPYSKNKSFGNAVIQLIFGNSGDRTGIADIKNVKLIIPDFPNNKILITFPSYTLVPPYEIMRQAILLSNIPSSAKRISIELRITIQFGAYNSRTTKYQHIKTVEKILKVLVNTQTGNEISRNGGEKEFPEYIGPLETTPY
jgi:hypothetical protein